MSTVDSASDARTANNVMRHTYRVLSNAEKADMQAIKDEGLRFHDLLSDIGRDSAAPNVVGGSRELSIAKTKIEEAVMWAVKHITA